MKAVEYLLQIVSFAKGIERLYSYVCLREMEMGHLLDHGARLRIIFHRVLDERFENRRRGMIEEAMQAQKEGFPLFSDSEIGGFILVPNNLDGERRECVEPVVHHKYFCIKILST